MDCRPPGSSVHGTLQARVLQWVTIPFSRGLSRARGRAHVSCSSRAGGSGPHYRAPGSPGAAAVLRLWLSFSLSVTTSSAVPWTTVLQASLCFISWSLLRLMYLESVVPSKSLILRCPLLLQPSAPRYFPMSQLFTAGGQSIGSSASVLPRIFRVDFL